MDQLKRKKKRENNFFEQKKIWMGKPKVIRVDFHNSLCTYFGGQTLTGAVHIENDEDINNMNGKIILVTIIFAIF